ncbi:YebC/PmpR family DNA-binding transcriptional regulator [Bacteriovorax sp. Seq25_V]|uniref:YebC/PmpR family DNA-binding transcriptional regulator n=1 Tax=Bacteriovorax sp. Seq25_V TaxID=1201288 RepID=UPI00038A0F58|nr:YebC/PmpR family DNA-binding transcriptional regulator [Bacteriovorax sp. Seq25_V]EQC47520.1 DNA-binding regulatory protein, YebC/PmpR family [Bacteriovorax sp. Seq25_V]
MGRKSAKIAAKKGAADKAKGQIYTRALKDVFMASKNGSPDPSTNFLLKVAIDRCKKFNVPKDNIDKAIKKGQGSDGVGFSDINYEGYGPGGVAIFVETSTDNNTRTVANVRSYFNKVQGSLGTTGSLEFVFERKAIFLVNGSSVSDGDEFEMEMINAGAEDISFEDDLYEISSEVEYFGAIQKKLEELGITPEEAQLERLPLNYKAITDEDTMKQFDRLITLLEEDDDVVQVYHNLEVEE